MFDKCELWTRQQDDVGVEGQALIMLESNDIPPEDMAALKFIYLFIWGFTSLSTLYRSYHDG